MSKLTTTIDLSRSLDELADRVLYKIIDRDPITTDFLSTAIRKEISNIDMKECAKGELYNQFQRYVESRLAFLEVRISELERKLINLQFSLNRESTSYDSPPLLVSLEDSMFSIRSELEHLKNKLEENE